MMRTRTRKSFAFSKMPETLFLKAEATGNVKMESRIIRIFSIIHKPGSHTWNSIQTNLMLPLNLRVLLSIEIFALF